MQNRIHKMFTSSLLLLSLMSLSVFAGNTGKVTGVVKDKETGDALPGVNV
ncbi:hypothetical protein JNL27_07765, partial [bacterium]|nr:hypothetical protein [bacterium]